MNSLKEWIHSLKDYWITYLSFKSLSRTLSILSIKSFVYLNAFGCVFFGDRERLIIKLDKFAKGVKERTTIEYIDEYLYGISIIEKLETHFVGEPEENKIKNF